MSTFYGKYPPTGSGNGGGTVTEVDTGAGLNGGPITTTGTIALDIPVTVAHGGTNSVASLNNNRVMQSSGGAIVEAAAITASSALASDSNGIPVASATTATELGFVNGVTSAIQTQLNGKQATLTIGNLTDVGTDGIVVTGGSGAVIGSGTSIAQHVADASHNGYLSSTDWSTFNAKQPALTIGNLTDAGTDGITVTGGTGSVIGAGTSIAQHVADASHNGYLSSTDWSTFNGKQSAGNYITALTGDVTASGPGSSAATVAKIQSTVVSGTTGSSNVVFSTSPTLVTPILGVPQSGTLTSCTGLPLSTGITGTLAIGNGGTGQTTKAPAFDALSPMTTAGDVIVGGTAGTGTRLAVGASGTVLKGGSSPSYASIVNADVSSSAAIDSSKINFDVTALSNAQATMLGHKGYLADGSTTYNGGFTITITGTSSWATGDGFLIPYQLQDGSWRLRFNIVGTTSTASSTTLTFATTGSTSVVFKNLGGTTNAQAAAARSDQNGATRAMCNDNASTLLITGPASSTEWSVSGDVQLQSKPSWAY